MFDKPKKIFKKAKEKFTPELKVWKSIEDMPAFNWFKIHETNKLAYLLLDYSDKLAEKNSTELSIHWQKLVFEFIDTFGISDEYRRILILQKEIAQNKCESVLNNDQSLLTLVEIAEIELKELTKTGPKQNIYQMKAALEKVAGHRIDVKTVTVAEYYGYINFAKEQAQANNG